MDEVIIGIDHGNGNIKTEHTFFPCGYKKQSVEPAGVFSKDIIFNDGIYYTLSDQKFPYKVDKTIDETCFVLTLFAIAKEINVRYHDIKEPFTGRNVVLAVGLPPAHFAMQHKKFKEYFLNKFRGGVSYRYNGRKIAFSVSNVMVYPQDYAAVMVYEQELLKKHKAYCIDIGEGTVDLLAIKDGTPDVSVMVSREYGISIMQNSIIDDVINDYAFTLEPDTIERVLSGEEEDFLDLNIEARIKQGAAEWTQYIIDQLHTKVRDFRNAPTIFCGGGSILLEEYLKSNPSFRGTIFIKDIKANALGYQKMAEAQLLRS